MNNNTLCTNNRKMIKIAPKLLTVLDMALIYDVVTMASKVNGQMGVLKHCSVTYRQTGRHGQGRYVAAKEQKYRHFRIIVGLCIQQSYSGSSHWLEDTKNSNGQKCSQLSQFFSRTSRLQMSVFS